MVALTSKLWVAKGGQWTRRGLAAGAAFISGETRPTRANVGLTDPNALTDLLPNSGQRYDVTVAGTTITNKRIKAHLRNLSGGKITFINCLITGEGTISATQNTAGAAPINYVDLGVSLNSSGSMEFINCEIEPFYCQFWINGFKGNGTTAANPHKMTKCVVTGLDALNGGSGMFMELTDCVLGPTMFNSVCNDQDTSTPPYWSHNDNIQMTSRNMFIKAFGCSFISGAGHAKGALSVLDASGTSYSTGYADRTWGCAITYSGTDGAVTGPVLDIDKCWFTGPSQQHIQCSIANVGNLGSVRRSRFDINTHSFGAQSFYVVRLGVGNFLSDMETNTYSTSAGALSRTIAGTTYTVTDGQPLVTATSGMSELQKSLAGYRPDNI